MNKPVWHDASVTRQDRRRAHGMVGMTVWLTGLSGSGKSTIAHALAARLTAEGIFAYVLDADNLRHGLNGDLGFSDDDRRENVRRVGEVARLFADAGAVTIVPIISPFTDSRDTVRSTHATDGIPFIEVFVATPLEECARRDPKGLYAKQRSGEMSGLSGVDAPYEAPRNADVTIGASGESIDDAVATLSARIAAIRGASS